jgi:hypothetical protein
MKKLTLILATCALAACKQTAPAPAPSDSAAPAAAASSRPTTADRAGTYTYDDGKQTGTSVLGADGNYTETSTDGKSVETGTWMVDDMGRVCLDPKGDDPKEPNRCFTMSEPDADGMMTATGDKGSVVKVKKTA